MKDKVIFLVCVLFLFQGQLLAENLYAVNDVDRYFLVNALRIMSGMNSLF
jgi:hypothetical protein